MTAAAPIPTALQRTIADFEEGKKPALARAVSIVENRREGADALLAHLHPRLGRARRIGITGPPGAGKSTITTGLAAAYRQAGLSVGIIAVDPTSPFTGGALLGDRIRMESIALDPGVFIRSMATRGSLGGLATATREVADVVDAFGVERLIIETVGVGQSELDVARIADSTVVVLVPESGDSIQTLKAGLMEIADVFVVNKSDRPGSDRLRHELELMLGLRSGEAFKNVPAHHGVDLGRAMTTSEKMAMTDERKRVDADARAEGRRVGNPARAARERARAQSEGPATSWTPPVFQTIAVKNEGTAELLAAIDRHFGYLAESGTLSSRRRARLRERVVEVAERTVRNRLWTHPDTNQWLDARLDALESGETNPFAVAEQLLAMSGDLLTRTNR